MWQLIDSETGMIVEETDSFSYLMKRFHDYIDEGRLVYRHFETSPDGWLWWSPAGKVS